MPKGQKGNTMKLLPNGNLESAEPVMAVRWCLERWEAVALKERAANNICVLFVIVYEGTDLEDRQLVPIDQMIAFLNFRRPGNHLVFAKVVWDKRLGATEKYLRESLLQKVSSRNYDLNLLNEERTGFRSTAFDLDRVGTLANDAELEIAVPKEHFPPEPPAWLAKLVNAGFDYPPVDQCAFRRRALWAPIKLSAFGLWAIVTTIIRVIVAAFLLLRGMRDINFAPIIHPWRNDIDDVWGNLRYTSSWFKYTKERRSRDSIWRYIFYPPFDIVVFFLLVLVKDSYHVSWLTLIGMFISAVWWRLLVVAFFVGFFLWLKYLANRAIRRQNELERSPEFREAQERRRLNAYDKLYKLLACRPGATATVESLPAEHRTIRLRFLDLKRKVCRPYAAR